MFTGLFAVVDVRQIDVRLYTVDTSIRVRTYRQIQPCRRPRPFGGRDAGEWDLLKEGNRGVIRVVAEVRWPRRVRGRSGVWSGRGTTGSCPRIAGALRSTPITNHLHPESCAGRCEAAVIRRVLG